MPDPTLDVRDLTVRVRLRTGASATVVDKVSFQIPPGGAMGLVGESGCGKTMTSLAITGLLPRVARIESGQILLEGDDLATKSQSELRKLRGKMLSMVLQDPMTALDPCYTIRSQLSEPLQQHRKLRGAELEAGLVEALEQVHLSAAKDRLNQYPHQLSGGMRQRVTSAIALAGRPSLLIADEPTTALDVTTQARYLGLLAELRERFGFALLLISHDLLVVRHVCDEVAVMYGGRIVEQGPTKTVFESPQHPYTRALLAAIPVLGEGVQLESIEGQAPDLYEPLPGCNFAPRCRFARDVCRSGRPPELLPHANGQAVRCFGTEPGGWIGSPALAGTAAALPDQPVPA